MSHSSPLLSVFSLDMNDSLHVRMPKNTATTLERQGWKKLLNRRAPSPQSSFPSKYGAISRATANIKLRKKPRDGPDEPSHTSPTVSPTAQNFSCSDFLRSSFSRCPVTLCMSSSSCSFLTFFRFFCSDHGHLEVQLKLHARLIHETRHSQVQKLEQSSPRR